MSGAPPAPSPGQDDDRPWRVIIDGWVRDPKIRRDALIGFILLLATAAIITDIAFTHGTAGLTGLLATTLGKIIAGSGAAGLVGTTGTLWYRNRKRSRSAIANTADLAGPH